MMRFPNPIFLLTLSATVSAEPVATTTELSNALAESDDDVVVIEGEKEVDPYEPDGSDDGGFLKTSFKLFANSSPGYTPQWEGFRNNRVLLAYRIPVIHTDEEFRIRRGVEFSYVGSDDTAQFRFAFGFSDAMFDTSVPIEFNKPGYFNLDIGVQWVNDVTPIEFITGPQISIGSLFYKFAGKSIVRWDELYDGDEVTSLGIGWLIGLHYEPGPLSFEVMAIPTHYSYSDMTTLEFENEITSSSYNVVPVTFGVGFNW